MKSTLERISNWFKTQSNGDWEHQSGIAISTLDNPGWSLKIDIVGTVLEHKAFDLISDRMDDENEWLRCWKEDGVFRGVCGPTRLEDVLEHFLLWAGEDE
jgi:hypothetical protein